MIRWFLISLFFVCGFCQAQYSISGYVDADRWQNTVFLSVIDDYRKISGVYSEQIIAKAIADSTGYFRFEGTALEDQQRMYRIHVENCPEDKQEPNHFNGHCDDIKEIIFIAKNKDTIHFPLSFDQEMFCDVTSSNPKSLAIVQIDSLKDEMRFAYSEIRSEANRKLNNKTWFKKLQDFGEALNEPLAELYIYTFLSDRSSDLHDYYLKDLETNNYYANLQERLASLYDNTSYSKQYDAELSSDQFLILKDKQDSSQFNWNYVIYVLLMLSLLTNLTLLLKRKNERNKVVSNLKAKLTKQEENILNLILDSKTNKEIAETMFVSVSTVKTHTNNIYRKLNVQSREEAKQLFSS